ncbi:MAG: hypothetical protein ABIN57_11130 [Chitinophagaceae bacterium]
MKQLLMGLILILLVGSASAQTKAKKPSKTKTKHTTTKTVKKGTTNQKQAVTAKPDAPLDPRKIYHWKDGQRSTPSGHVATSVNGDNAAIKKDTATKKQVVKHDQ